MIPTPASPTDDAPDYVAVWFSLLAAAVYLVGWSYLYGYYTAFGLSVRSVGLSAYDILLESIRMLQVNRWWAAGLMGLSLLLVVGVRFFATKANPLSSVAVKLELKRIRRSTLTLLVLGGLLFLLPTVFTVCAAAGRHDALEHMQESSPALPAVALEFAPDQVPSGLFDPDEVTGGRLVDAGYRLLAATDKSYFLVRPLGRHATAAGGAPTQALVIEVAREGVRGLRYLAAQR